LFESGRFGTDPDLVPDPAPDPIPDLFLDLVPDLFPDPVPDLDLFPKDRAIKLCVPQH
jgi:hypothetical protein